MCGGVSVLVLGGELGGGETAYLDGHGPVLAVDHGADHALALGLTPDLLLGDLDSISAAARQACAGAEVLRFPTDKNYTDGELAFQEAARRGWRRLLVLAAWGGPRPEHLLTNIFQAAALLEQFDEVILPGAGFCAYLRQHHYQVRAAQGRQISLVPLTAQVTGVTTRGMRWPLVEATLAFGDGRGLSNLLEGETGAVSYQSGKLLLVQSAI